MTAEYKPFNRVLRDLLIEREIVTKMGNPNWIAFTELMDGVSYETLRKANAGERKPSASLMEAAADALDLDPEDTFVEYRILKAQEQFDPSIVGIDQALANLEAWASTPKKRPRRR